MFRLPVFHVLQYMRNISSNAFHIYPLKCTLCLHASDFNNTIMKYIIPILTIYLYIHYAKFVFYSFHCNKYIIVFIYVICTKHNTIQKNLYNIVIFIAQLIINIVFQSIQRSCPYYWAEEQKPSSFIDTVSHTTNDNDIFFDA